MKKANATLTSSLHLAALDLVAVSDVRVVAVPI